MPKKAKKKPPQGLVFFPFSPEFMADIPLGMISKDPGAPSGNRHGGPDA